MPTNNAGNDSNSPPKTYHDPLPDGPLPGLDLSSLDNKKYPYDPAHVSVESFRGRSYTDLLNSVRDANVSASACLALDSIGEKIRTSTQDFSEALKGLEGEGDWKGKTHAAMIANVRKSFAHIKAAANGAHVLAVLEESFGELLGVTKGSLIGYEDQYHQALKDFPNSADSINHDFDTYAQRVMTGLYTPWIKEIAAKNPAFVSDHDQASDNGSGSHDGKKSGDDGDDDTGSKHGSGDGDDANSNDDTKDGSNDGNSNDNTKDGSNDGNSNDNTKDGSNDGNSNDNTKDGSNDASSAHGTGDGSASGPAGSKGGKSGNGNGNDSNDGKSGDDNGASDGSESGAGTGNGTRTGSPIENLFADFLQLAPGLAPVVQVVAELAGDISQAVTSAVQQAVQQGTPPGATVSGIEGHSPAGIPRTHDAAGPGGGSVLLAGSHQSSGQTRLGALGSVVGHEPVLPATFHSVAPASASPSLPPMSGAPVERSGRAGHDGAHRASLLFSTSGRGGEIVDDDGDVAPSAVRARDAK
jgi:hypothetical protein